MKRKPDPPMAPVLLQWPSWKLYPSARIRLSVALFSELCAVPPDVPMRTRGSHGEVDPKHTHGNQYCSSVVAVCYSRP